MPARISRTLRQTGWEIQGEKLMVYSRGRLVYVADLGQIMLAKLTPGREEAK